MKLRNIKLLFCAAIFITYVSCSKDDIVSPSGGDGVAVSVKAEITGTDITPSVSDANWNTNDAIGLTMMNQEQTAIINNAFNYIYETPTGTTSFVPRSADNTAYFPQDGSSVKIKAYYPYNAQLGKNMIIPVSVSNQNILPQVDLLTTEHLAGFSKNDANVKLNFHHRLSKLIFNFSMEGGQTVSLDKFQLTIKGMKTKGSYDLVKDALTIDAASDLDLAIPYRSVPAERYSIVLPRAAADGVIFEFKASDGSIYTAKMSSDLTLESGYKYTFNIVLRKTPVTVSATVEEWKEGTTSYYDALEISTPAGDSYGVTVGDEMNVYMKDGNDFSFLEKFTYNNNGKWDSSSPIYWASITNDPAILRSSIIALPALNNTQLPDILISDEIRVNRNTGANFKLGHAASKVGISLVSQTFSAEDLAGATITLPNYLIGGKEANGIFVPGTQKGDIQVDRKQPVYSMALFQPQTVASGDAIVKVVMNGRTYTATSDKDIVFGAGIANILTITINKELVSVSVHVADWINMEPIDLNAITVGTAVSGGTGAVLDGDKMDVYHGDITTRTFLSQFTYNQAANIWNPLPKVFWDDLENPATFFASILRMARYNDTQLDDYLVAKPVKVTANNGVAFQLSHPAAKVTVELKSSDGSYTVEQLERMTITLPNYTKGPNAYDCVSNGVFVPATGGGDITVATGVGTNGKSAIAIIQPQTIVSGQPVVKFYSPDTQQTYNATYDADIVYDEGVAMVLRFDLKKTAITMSADVIDWEKGNTINLLPTALTISGSLDETSDFFKNKTIHIYKPGSDFEHSVYSFLPATIGTGYVWSGAPILYWDNRTLPLDLTAICYPSQVTVPAITASTTSFAYSLPTNQKGGYIGNDLLTSHLSLTQPSFVNFKFIHPLSRVRVLLKSDEFTAAELAGAQVKLKNFFLNGNLLLSTGKFNGQSNKKDVDPLIETDGAIYSALVMPQVIAANTELLTVTLTGYPNTPFSGKHVSILNFYEGKETVITVTLKKTVIELSATLEDWGEGDKGGIIIQ